MAAEKEVSMLTYLAIYFMTASISITVGVSIVAGTRAMANIIPKLSNIFFIYISFPYIM